ncbi:unnamed protein product [Dibothriocephalus latus]|uniref:Uncharacterized protein n=1 Tax=Dibothriocephalus latus TaxID=60516 RepID=A0A3P6SRP4_DIBLA|nr:unnamed protein product [Dibothriocephalus latus]
MTRRKWSDPPRPLLRSFRQRLVLTFHLAMTSFKGPPGSRVTDYSLSRLPYLPVLGLLLLSLLLTIINFSTSSPLLVSAHTDFFYQSTHLFQPPDPSRPCRHIFRNDVDTSALLADFVLEGIPIPTYQSPDQAAGLLYNASIHVRQVAKRPAFSIYPVRKDFPILAGPFSRRTDLGRCWVNVQFGARYIFFIERPNWAGFFQITQIPVRFTVKRWQTIQNIVRRGVANDQSQLHFNSTPTTIKLIDSLVHYF